MHLVHDHVLEMKAAQHGLNLTTDIDRPTTHLELLIIDRAEVNICLQRLARYTRSKHVFAPIAETVVHENL